MDAPLIYFPPHHLTPSPPQETLLSNIGVSLGGTKIPSLSLQPLSRLPNVGRPQHLTLSNIFFYYYLLLFIINPLSFLSLSFYYYYCYYPPPGLPASIFSSPHDISSIRQDNFGDNRRPPVTLGRFRSLHHFIYLYFDLCVVCVCVYMYYFFISGLLFSFWASGWTSARGFWQLRPQWHHFTVSIIPLSLDRRKKKIACKAPHQTSRDASMTQIFHCEGMCLLWRPIHHDLSQDGFSFLESWTQMMISDEFERANAAWKYLAGYIHLRLLEKLNGNVFIPFNSVNYWNISIYYLWN